MIVAFGEIFVIALPENKDTIILTFQYTIAPKAPIILRPKVETIIIAEGDLSFRGHRPRPSFSSKARTPHFRAKREQIKTHNSQ